MTELPRVTMTADMKTALEQVTAAIVADPRAGQLVLSAEARWLDGMTCEAAVRKFAPILVDEPPLLGGNDSAPNPMELLLVALGTCQEIMYTAYAAVMGIQLEEVQVRLTGQLDLRGLFGLDPTVPAGYTRIDYETRLRSSEPEERLRQLQELAETHCPLLDMLRRLVEVQGRLIIER